MRLNDILTHAYYGKYGLRERIDMERLTNRVVITLMTRVEILRGRFDAIMKAADGSALSRAQSALQASELYLTEFPVLMVETTATNLFDRFRADKKLKKLDLGDLLIACICLANDATLVTRNIKDFSLIAGLRIVNWAV